MDVDQALEPPDQGDTEFEATWVLKRASLTQLAQIPALKTDLEKDCFRYLHVVFAGYLKVRGCVASFFLILFFVGSFYVRIAIHKTGCAWARLASKPVAGAATQCFLAPPKIQCETGRKTKTISDDMAWKPTRTGEARFWRFLDVGDFFIFGEKSLGDYFAWVTFRVNILLPLRFGVSEKSLGKRNFPLWIP